MNRTRRSILAGTAALLGAGCLGRGAEDGSPSDTTPTGTTTTTPPAGTTSPPPTGTTETPDGSSLQGVSVHQSVAKRGTVHTDVASGVFVVATFVDDGATSRSGTTLVLDGASHDPVDWVVPAPDGEVAAGFEFPTDGVDAGGGRIEWGSASTSLSEATLARLRSPPQFSVREFSVPDAAPVRSDVTAEFIVENTGESDGRFLAELGTLALSDQSEITVEVPAGERATATQSVTLFREHGEETVVLGTGDDRLERTVSLEES